MRTPILIRPELPVQPAPSNGVLPHPNYFLEIHPPPNHSGTDLFGPIQQYDVSDPMRFLLPPSVGWGRNSCYRVVWREVIRVPVDFIGEAKPRVRIIRTEYWRVPRVDGVVLSSHGQWDAPLGRLTTALAPMVRGNGAFDEFVGAASLAIGGIKVRIAQNIADGLGVDAFNVPGANFVFNGVYWDNTLPPGTPYEIEYVIPFSHREVLFIEDDEARTTSRPRNFVEWNDRRWRCRV